MPKVLDMEMVSNAEVLNFIKAKKTEYKQQDSEDAKAGRKGLSRPKTVIRSLDQHQEHLESEHYPYASNPSVYGKAGMTKTLTGASKPDNQARSDVAAESKFSKLFAEQIILPTVKTRIAAKKTRLGRDLSPEEKETIINDVDNQRYFSETERLMVINHAPTCLETLQPMIDSIEERYTEEEQALIVDAIQQAFRPDQPKAEETADGDVEMQS